jgi:hypothetical protein
MNEPNYKITGIGLRKMTRRECKKTGESVAVVHDRLRQFPVFDDWVAVDEVAAAFQKMAADMGAYRPDPAPEPGPFGNVHLLGVQLLLTPAEKIKVFFGKTTPAENVKKAVKIIKAHRDEIIHTFQLAEVFRLQFPGYCPSCRCFADGWRLSYNRSVNFDWCCYSGLVEGKADKPIRLVRFEREYQAFKRYRGRKLIPCQLLKGIKQNEK